MGLEWAYLFSYYSNESIWFAQYQWLMLLTVTAAVVVLYSFIYFVTSTLFWYCQHDMMLSKVE